RARVKGMPDNLSFKSLSIGAWQQFALVRIEFHDRLTVITGANGSGKSTLLNILARHVGTERPYFGIPKRDSRGLISFISSRLSWTEFWSGRFGNWQWKPSDQIGEIEYSDGNKTSLTVPNDVGSSYQINIPQQQGIAGLVIGSHRLMPQYKEVPNI